jgi:hypothetical protein
VTAERRVFLKVDNSVELLENLFFGLSGKQMVEKKVD